MLTAMIFQNFLTSILKKYFIKTLEIIIELTILGIIVAIPAPRIANLGMRIKSSPIFKIAPIIAVYMETFSKRVVLRARAIGVFSAIIRNVHDNGIIALLALIKSLPKTMCKICFEKREKVITIGNAVNI